MNKNYSSDNIKRLLHIANRIPFYKKKYFGINIDAISSYEEFQTIPVLEKKDIVDGKDLVDPLIDLTSLRMERTSGSTGKVLDVYWNKLDFIRSNKEVWKLRTRLHNIGPQHRMLQFHPFISDNVSIYNTDVLKLNNNTLSLSWINIDIEHIEAYHREMLTFDPEWIYGSPGAIFQYVKMLKQFNLSTNKSLRYIEFAGDYVLPSCREEVQSFFNVPIGNMYGAREINTIAYECKCGNLHIVPQNVLVEVLDNDNISLGYGKTGNIVLTGLANGVMPFIRYKIGDRGCLLHGSVCNCGNSNPILSLEHGRITDIVYFEGRQPISAVIFWYAVQHINFNYMNVIKQFQVRQETLSKFIVLIVIDKKADFNIIRHMFLEFLYAHNMNSVEWIIKEVDIIPYNQRTGKLSYFIKNLIF